MEGKLHLYTGDGKGKTTAAMGLALRALGHGQRVLAAQFLKDGRSGELAALRRFPDARVWDAVPLAGFVFQMTAAERAAARASPPAQAQALRAAVLADAPHLIVLDELALALCLDMVDEAAARDLISASLTRGETVVTGRQAPAWLHDRADYVSVITAEKHPYAAEGLPARAGVEY